MAARLGRPAALFAIIAVVVGSTFVLLWNDGVDAPVPNSECWGCAALSDLKQTLTGDAEDARSVLDRALGECRLSDECRMNPSELFAATCAGPWPNEPTFARLSQAIGAISAVAGACRDTVCPDINCARRAQTVAVLSELQIAITDAHAASFQANTEVSGQVDAAKALLAELGSVVAGGQESAVWIQRANAWRAELDRNPASADPAVGWRLHQSSFAMAEIVRRLESTAGAIEWASIYEFAAEAAIQLEAATASQTAASTMACGGFDEPQAMALRDLARDAGALLAVCSARAACSAVEASSGLAATNARELPAIDGLRAFGDAAADSLERLSDLEFVAQPSPTIRLERESFSTLEAILVELDISTTACMAEPGATLAILPERGGDPLYETELEGRPLEDVLLEAPSAIGAYEVAAIAPISRGGGVTAIVPFAVTQPLPQACESFGGVWDTEFGELVLVQHDQDVRGTYRRFEGVRPGFLVGTVSDGVLRGDWESELGSGSVRLRLAGDGLSFSGSWTHSLGASAGSGRWSGTCTLPN